MRQVVRQNALNRERAAGLGPLSLSVDGYSSPLYHDERKAPHFRSRRDRFPQPQRRPDQRFRRLFRHLAMACCAGCFGVLTHYVLTDGGQRTRAGISVLPRMEQLVIAAGFGVDQVSLSGHRYTSDNDIFEALDLEHVRSLLAFDSAALRNRLEQLPWVRSVELTRVYPGQVHIAIKERTPFAVWQRAGRDYLIDRSGRVLAPIRPGEFAGLEKVSGDGAAKEAALLFAVLDQFSGLSQFIDFSERVGERRWTLRLKSGGTLHLPADGETRSLKAFLSQKGAKQLLTTDARTIDLRAKGRVAVRPTAGLWRQSMVRNRYG